MEQFLELSDGTVLNDSYVLQAGNTLWVYIYDQHVSFDRAFELLFDTGRNRMITAVRYGTIAVYDGFTELYCITKENGGFISAGLRK